MKLKKKKNEKNAENRRVKIETNTGTNLLNMSKFLMPGLEDDCPICTKPLRTAGMPVVELKPCDHKFHEKCINEWTVELDKR